MVRGILFDLDGTLFDRDRAVHDLVLEQHGRFGAALEAVDVNSYVARVLDLDAHGHGDKAAVYLRVAADFGLPTSLAATLTADFWSNYHSFCQSVTGALFVLTELRHRGLKLGVITNGVTQVQAPVLERLGFVELLDVILISEREGVRKPNLEIFARACRKLELRADETWYVGDHPEVDVKGAASAGLTAIWKRTHYWPTPTVPHTQIENLLELIPLVRESS